MEYNKDREYEKASEHLSRTVKVGGIISTNKWMRKKKM